MNKISGVYAIYCYYGDKTHLWYIGSSLDIKFRITQHIRKLRANKHENVGLQNEYNNIAPAKLYGCDVRMYYKHIELNQDLKYYEQVAIYIKKPEFNQIRSASGWIENDFFKYAVNKIKGL